MYAVIQTAGKQFIVKEGDILALDKMDTENGKEIIFDKVLLYVDKEAKVGTPYVENATVSANVEETLVKDDKLIIMKYKRKTGYMKKAGHRQKYTTVKIKKITV